MVLEVLLEKGYPTSRIVQCWTGSFLGRKLEGQTQSQLHLTRTDRQRPNYKHRKLPPTVTALSGHCSWVELNTLKASTRNSSCSHPTRRRDSVKGEYPPKCRSAQAIMSRITKVLSCCRYTHSTPATSVPGEYCFPSSSSTSARPPGAVLTRFGAHRVGRAGAKSTTRRRWSTVGCYSADRS